MKIDCGIIGLPNVGKSTFFKVLTNMSVKIANFPFCTIRPNVARIKIPDPRIYQLIGITKSRQAMHGIIEFVDIAGLIAGAAQGEGLGDRTLAYIREVKVLCHVVRCFDDDRIIHIAGNINPNRDINIVNTELILFDILQCEKNILFFQKNNKIFDKNIKQKLFILDKCLIHLNNGILLRSIPFSHAEQMIVQNFNFLTFKPIIYVANVNMQDINNDVYQKKLKNIVMPHENRLIISCCATLLSSCDFNIKDNYDDNNHIDDIVRKREYVLKNIINNIFYVLDLYTFFTVNTRMARAWIDMIGTTALEMSGRVHSDFKKRFIRVQVIKFKDFITCKSELEAKKSGKIRFEGKSYCIEEGDILKFLFNV